MLASEALFDGAPLAHVVAWEERQRLARIDNRVRMAMRERRHGGRSRDAGAWR